MRLALFSLFIFTFASCVKMPPITICLSDVPRQIFHCIDREGKPFDCAFDDKMCADKLVSIPFEDYGTVLDYCSALKPK